MEIAARLKVTRFNWRTLLRLAVVGNLIVLLTMFIALNDTLALALAAIILVGLGLLRFRGGMLGVVILGLISTDIAVYTVTGAVSNIIHGEGLLDIIIPTLLGSSSLAGLIAAIAVGLRRRYPQAGEQAARVVAGGAAALIVLLLATSAFFRPAVQEVALPAGDLRLVTENMAYSLTELAADNREVSMSLTNYDLFWHTFTIDELDVDLQVPVGGERHVTFTAAPGTYTFYCAIPGHEALGMRGTITIP